MTAMQDIPVFDQLVRGLNSAERRELLEKIRSAFATAPKALYGSRSQVPPSINVEEEVSRFNLIKRIILFFKSLFSAKDKISLVKDIILRDVKKQLHHQAGGLINFFSSSFTDRMYSELSALADAVGFFKVPLTQALKREKNDFYAYLAGTELRETQGRLEDEIKIYDPLSEDSRFDESVSRAEMLERFQAIVEAIPPEEKRRVYKDAQALYYLYHLSRYSLEPLLACFRIERGGTERKCDFQDAVKYLMKLADRLIGAKNSPSADALRVLFLFQCRGELKNEEFDLEQEITEDLSKADDALSAIRRFNDRVPVALIVRYITRNLDYTPKQMGGAEDWFVIFKEFWEQRIEWSYREYQRNKRHANLTKGAKDYLGVSELPMLSCYDSSTFGEEATIRYAFSVSFLKAFYERVFRRMHKPLELIMLQGQFYKQQNREEYADTFDAIVQLGGKVVELESQLNEKGYFGSKIVAIQKGGLSREMKTQQIDEILVDANSDALQLIDQAIEKLQKLVQLLAGILHGEPGAKFDTIANLSTLGGRENNLISTAWENSLKNASQAANILRDIRDLEAS